MTKDQLKAMAGRIKKRRDALGYTQEKFAETIDLTSSSYTKIENAFQQPSLDSLIRISEKLDVSLQYLVFGGEHEPKTDDVEVMRSIFGSVDAEKMEHVKDLLARIIKAKLH